MCLFMQKKNHEQHAPLRKAQVTVSIRARKQKDCDSDTPMDPSNKEFSRLEFADDSNRTALPYVIF